MTSEEREPTEREVAFHEAGHAVMFWLEGRSIDEVSIARRYDASGTLRDYGHVRPKPGLSFAELDTLKQPLMIGLRITLAGPVAELEAKGELTDGQVRYSGADAQQAEELSESILRYERSTRSRQTKRSREGLIYWQWCVVCDTLAEKWPLVEALAHALLQSHHNGTILGSEAEQIIMDAEFEFFARRSPALRELV